MKKFIIILVFILVVGGWSAKKYLEWYTVKTEEKERFMEYATQYSENAQLFLTAKVKLHHDTAFAESYQMWKLWPPEEIDLKSYYDETTYYNALGAIIKEEAEREGQSSAYRAFVDIGKRYGVPPVKVPVKKPVKKPAKQPEKKKSDVPAGKSALEGATLGN